MENSHYSQFSLLAFWSNWDENGDFVEPKVEFEPPWYLCSNGHITQMLLNLG